MDVKYQTPFPPKAKQNARVSNINWPLSAKLKCQHNKKHFVKTSRVVLLVPNVGIPCLGCKAF